MSNSNKKPDFIAYSVVDGSDDESYWHQIGAVWFHNDVDGINIKLSAIPLTGQLILRKPKPKQEGW